jgi:hypothetical protein
VRHQSSESESASVSVDGIELILIASFYSKNSVDYRVRGL